MTKSLFEQLGGTYYEENGYFIPDKIWYYKQHATFVKCLPKTIESCFAFLYNKSIQSKRFACRKLVFI